ncbi:MAG: PrsW family intramembrane metalloprotease [Anaerolineales bacterium]|jgi:RsiW-degrading membrane proteinase PrsW (M82 family)
MGEVQEASVAQNMSKVVNSWWRVLLIGLLFYIASLIALVLTSNPVLFPTVVMIGSFMIPVTYVAFFYDRRHLSRLTVPGIAQSFIYGGLIGVLAASVLEPLFIRHLDFVTAFGVGLIEEFVKVLGILVIARRLGHDSEMDGLLLGVAAGMGFAALESNGYAFSAFLRSGGSLTLTVFVTLLRGILSPIGHGTWTAILTSVLFRESRDGHYRLNLKVIGAYLGVSILHGLWDGLPGAITALFGQGLDVFAAQAAVGIVGLFILWRRWREAKRLQLESLAAEESEEPEVSE